MAGYSTTPLPKKLGIREGAIVGVPTKGKLDVAILFSIKKKDLKKA